MTTNKILFELKIIQTIKFYLCALCAFAGKPFSGKSAKSAKENRESDFFSN